ncbi:coiled-coil domain-containing protein 63 isoform X2 [Zootermopsis nevadensis]|uniref:Coiled-coil domain-containing protein 63 n=3 Tax=Zootermopsis nevadensis TaxID=136037 RepID=A0A067QWQ4_ZOONE|nr:coiled-coil domain-containing protein 63 isoform X2 [Zootermopsis nevadensis]XP_021936288.1 coiled-coil domain-containing protein 63 isoform X2 [Zootermopsis nevadensis]XP_021936289.1 coiled-coil domain-containing protein 63 isoform X2 [Zootermopsis nevadensis]XP_021936290.1 coiled-coil domain-containing protein 63 isoform X2 [Zootermopsis nevadensis]XP_021936291.1 coiled-coil domain-containing protein 63 isoform X2 [Zootermopsis nevadensis]XP_021936292.1 coiled-coil domain-containing prote
MALRKATAEDLDMNHLAKAELSRLQRQYRIMEGDRQSYSQETNIVLRKQRRMIKTLEAERKELLTNLHVAKSPLNDVKDNKVTSELARLLNLTDRYDAAVKSEKLQLSELNLQIKKVEKEVLELKKLDISDNVLLQKSRNTERNVSSLENRLGVVTGKFNMVIAGNGKMRDEINHLLKERSYFNKSFQQLVSRLNSGKKVMVDLIEQATLAYDQREESQNKLQALKERAKQDLQQQSQEIRELQRRLDRDVKLQEFLGVKGQRRIMADLEAREALRFKKKREAAEHMITTFEKILSQIKEFSGETDIDRLAAQFVKQEEENFAIFNYVNELNNEVEALQDQVWNLHQKIEDQRDLRNRRVLQQQETLARLASTLTEKTSSADCVQRKLQECSAILEKLLQGIEHIFHLMRCDRAPVLFLLGDNKHVTAYNVMLYLDIIERRIIDLMNVMCCLE